MRSAVFFYLQYTVVTVMVIMLALTPWMIMNEYEVRTKEPRTMILLGQDEVDVLTTSLRTEVHFLSSSSCVCESDECVADAEHLDDGWMLCSPEIELAVTGIDGKVFLSCRMGSRLCEIRALCEDCAFIKSLQPRLDIKIGLPQIMTDAFMYSVNSTSGYPGQHSAITGSAWTEDDMDTFRGYDPSVISVEVVETLYEDFVNDIVDTGALVSSLGIEHGSVVSVRMFSKETGLRFTVKFVVNGNAIRITRRQIFTLVTVVSSASGLLFAFAGAFATLMRLTEYTCTLFINSVSMQNRKVASL
eukprot:Rmarinus@m.3404